MQPTLKTMLPPMTHGPVFITLLLIASSVGDDKVIFGGGGEVSPRQESWLTHNTEDKTFTIEKIEDAEITESSSYTITVTYTATDPTAETEPM